MTCGPFRNHPPTSIALSSQSSLPVRLGEARPRPIRPPDKSPSRYGPCCPRGAADKCDPRLRVSPSVPPRVAGARAARAGWPGPVVDPTEPRPGHLQHDPGAAPGRKPHRPEPAAQPFGEALSKLEQFGFIILLAIIFFSPSWADSSGLISMSSGGLSAFRSHGWHDLPGPRRDRLVGTGEFDQSTTNRR